MIEDPIEIDIIVERKPRPLGAKWVWEIRVMKPTGRVNPNSMVENGKGLAFTERSAIRKGRRAAKRLHRDLTLDTCTQRLRWTP